VVSRHRFQFERCLARFPTKEDEARFDISEAYQVETEVRLSNSLAEIQQLAPIFKYFFFLGNTKERGVECSPTSKEGDSTELTET